MKMSQEEMGRYCKDFLEEEYGLPFTIPVTVNARLSRTFGRFIYNRKEQKPVGIEINKKFLIGGKITDIQDVLKHECVHYALFAKGKPYRDGERYFENELARLGVSSSNTIEFHVEILKQRRWRKLYEVYARAI